LDPKAVKLMHLTIFSGNGGAKFARKRSFFIAFSPSFAQAASLIPESSPSDAQQLFQAEDGIDGTAHQRVLSRWRDAPDGGWPEVRAIENARLNEVREELGGLEFARNDGAHKFFFSGRSA
jgi:hypothetical protein